MLNSFLFLMLLLSIVCSDSFTYIEGICLFDEADISPFKRDAVFNQYSGVSALTCEAVSSYA